MAIIAGTFPPRRSMFSARLMCGEKVKESFRRGRCIKDRHARRDICNRPALIVTAAEGCNGNFCRLSATGPRMHGVARLASLGPRVSFNAAGGLGPSDERCRRFSAFFRRHPPRPRLRLLPRLWFSSKSLHLNLGEREAEGSERRVARVSVRQSASPLCLSRILSLSDNES